ncbi:MAG: hypothetical protein KKH98_12450 [Spirochaetes bacterium]|nr:hypothetical protein [Spirochaetota bacterium]
MKRLIIYFIIFLFLCSQSLNAAFEIQEAGARNTAMAGAVTSFVKDASAVFYNPGALALVQNSEILLTQLHPYSWDLLMYHSLAFVHPLEGTDTIGLSVSYLGTLRDEDYKEQIDYNELMISAAYGFYLPFIDGLSMGFSMKYLSTGSREADSAGFALDVGGVYSMNSKVDLGITFKDITLGHIKYSTGHRETLNPSVTLGASAEFFRNFIGSCDLNMKVKEAVDPFTAGLGLQYVYKFIGVRAGFKYGGKENLFITSGLGVVLPYLQGIGADYAFVYNTGLNYSNMFSINIKF